MEVRTTLAGPAASHRSDDQRFSPDIVALQEVGAATITQADELAKSLGIYAVHASPSYPPAPTGTDVPDFEVDSALRR